jgi:hypothetical protein
VEEDSQQEGMVSDLRRIQETLHQMFTGHEAGTRLDQLDYHCNTAIMAIQHLFEESKRMEGYK